MNHIILDKENQGIPIRIDLGCGKKKKPGFTGFDLKKDTDADHVCDLSQGIPLDDNSVDEIYTSHFLEHVEDYNFLMREMIRVCKDGSKIEIILPYHSYVGARLHSHWDNPHRYLFSEAYFCWKDVNPCFDNYEIEKITYKYVNQRGFLYGLKGIRSWLFYIIYKYLISNDTKRKHFLNSVEEFRVVLRVKK